MLSLAAQHHQRRPRPCRAPSIAAPEANRGPAAQGREEQREMACSVFFVLVLGRCPFFVFLFWFRCICEQPAARRRSGRWQGRAGGAGRERGGGAGRHRISRFPPPSPVHVGAKKSWFLARTPEAARGHPTPKGRGGRCAGRRRAAPEGPRPAQMDFPGSAAIPAQYPAPTQKVNFSSDKCFSKYRKAELLPFRPSGPAHRDRRGDPLGD